MAGSRVFRSLQLSAKSVSSRSLGGAKHVSLRAMPEFGRLRSLHLPAISPHRLLLITPSDLVGNRPVPHHVFSASHRQQPQHNTTHNTHKPQPLRLNGNRPEPFPSTVTQPTYLPTQSSCQLTERTWTEPWPGQTNPGLVTKGRGNPHDVWGLARGQVVAPQAFEL